MIKLTIIELKKIFHKKSIYIILILMFLFCLINNYLYNKDYNNEGFYKYSKKENNKEKIKTLKSDLEKYNINDTNQQEKYLFIKTQIDILTIKKEWNQDTWQYNIIDNVLFNLIKEKNRNTYITKNKEEQEIINTKYGKIMKELKNDNWKYFFKEELVKKIEQKEIIQKKITELNREEILNQEKELAKEINILRYRLNNNIKPGKNYLNEAYEKMITNKTTIDTLSNNKLTKEEEIIKENAEAEYKINKYILDHKKNINKENTLNYQLRTLTEDYELFLVILILIIASTTICEEFSKGTIKLLLIKPYSRCKILLSKYLACLITLLIAIIFLILTELIIGIPLLKADSLKLPVIIYHFGKKEIIEYSIWTYMWIRIIARMPFFIMLLTISFTLSVLFTSITTSISIPILIYLLDSFIKAIETKHYIKYTKYLINTHWHLEKYLFGKHFINKINTLKQSIIIWLFYFIVLSILTLYHFKKKDIKNI